MLAIHGIALLYEAQIYQRTHTQTHKNTIEEVHNHKHNIRRITTTTIDEMLAFYFLYTAADEKQNSIVCCV